jgi:hypothetical protein
MALNNFSDFITALLNAGFSTGSGHAEGVYAVVPFAWNEVPPFRTKVRWHTGDPETDPWEWRIRVLDERDDIAYGKVFFKKSGYITKEWYPYFLAARRKGMDFDEQYARGALSGYAKRIYSVVKDGDALPLHEIKRLGGFSKEDKSRFDAAVIELQMGLHITICGRKQKVSLTGEEYGWSSTVFCAAEKFWEKGVFVKAGKISPKEAVERITEQVHRLNSNANAKKVQNFIEGLAVLLAYSGFDSCPRKKLMAACFSILLHTPAKGKVSER